MLCNFKQFLYKFYQSFLVGLVLIKSRLFIWINDMLHKSCAQGCLIAITKKVPKFALFHIIVFLFIFSPFSVKSVFAFSVFEEGNKFQHSVPVFEKVVVNNDMATLAGIIKAMEGGGEGLSKFYTGLKMPFVSVSFSDDFVFNDHADAKTNYSTDRKCNCVVNWKHDIFLMTWGALTVLFLVWVSFLFDR